MTTVGVKGLNHLCWLTVNNLLQ